MPFYQYLALDEAGREHPGRLEAGDVRAAANILRGRSLYVVEIKDCAGEISGTELSAGTSSHSQGVMNRILGILRPIRERDQIFFLQQMALMLRSGLTLLQALEICRQQSQKYRLNTAIGRISTAVQSGKSFSQSVARERGLFPTIVIKLIESAEISGELDTVLDRSVTYLRQKSEMRRNLLSSLIYPMIVVLVGIGVAIFLIVNVIPKFAHFFMRKHVALPWATQMLMDLSEYARAYGVLILVFLGVVAAAVWSAYNTREGRMILDRGLLRLPVIGKLLTVGAMAHLSRTLSTLLRNGVTLVESLRIGHGAIGNRALSSRVEQAADQILKGREFAESLRDPLIPTLVPQVVAVGEKTGALDDVLSELGDYYDRELQASVKRMSVMVEPVLILIVGAMVGFVYFAFFQAVFQLATVGG